MSFNASTTYSQAVQEACLTRLGQSGSIQPTASSKEVNRKEAIDIAKASADTYVVWFELEADSNYNSGGGMGSVPPQYLTVRFEMYTPTTGKTKTSGHIYSGLGTGGLPIPGSGRQLRSLFAGYAGREMADRVLDNLGVAHRLIEGQCARITDRIFDTGCAATVPLSESRETSAHPGILSGLISSSRYGILFRFCFRLAGFTSRWEFSTLKSAETRGPTGLWKTIR
jgi:hypothetical protein